MQVVATAGHVDHGKSALVRALTGMEPDRWAEERRRGLTIDLGFAWTDLPGGQRVAFVDVPGHERFVPNMLAGVGPVPAVLFVVAADGGWMPQSAEHLAAIDAMGIRHGLLAVTRADLADPGAATRQALDEIARTSLGAVEAVAVSAVTGAGLPALRAALTRLAAALPAPAADAPVRLWVDRAFTIKGSGTVVTGTLPAGTIRASDELLLSPSLRPARIRAIESLGESATAVAGVARVALNLRGIPPSVPARGMALITPARWTLTTQLDVRLHPHPAHRLPAELTVHIGSARTVARLRPLTPFATATAFARLTLRDPLPLHVGDRLLLRDPGAATPMLLAATVLDPAPPPLTRRGAAATAAAELATWPEIPVAADLLHRHHLLRASTLAAMGITGLPAPGTAGWLADPAHWAHLQRQLAELVTAHAEAEPLSAGIPTEAARASLDLPDRVLVDALVRAQELVGGTAGVLYRRTSHLPARVPISPAVQAVLEDLHGQPFVAPEAARLRELGLDNKAIAAAARAGHLLRITDQIVLAPGADKAAARVLAGLPQPFTTAAARQALGTTRRVAIPLLEYLDRAKITERLPDDRRGYCHRMTEGNLAVHWIHGSESAKHNTDPDIQVHAYAEDTYILRQNKAVNYEAPFMFLLFGGEQAVLIDTGATESAEYFPLRRTVDGLIDRWLAGHPRHGYRLLVLHTHAHGDHVAGDGQFAGRPDTRIVGAKRTPAWEFFGFGDDPGTVAQVDLGGRVLECLPTPGHHEAAVTFYDPRTGLLLTGDTVYPGRLYIQDWADFAASIDRLVAFAATRQITHVLGCHVEMSTEPGVDYLVGTTYQPEERPLQMTAAQLSDVQAAVRQACGRPGRHVFADFILDARGT